MFVFFALSIFPLFHQQTPAIQARETKPIVCIDPGHPSEVSSGTELQNGTTEVYIAWMVGLKLQKALEARGCKVILTKSKVDTLVKNRDRAQIANAAGAALMIRLHCDATADSGFAIYYPDRQGTKDGVTGPAPEVIQRSQQAAAAIHAEMIKFLNDALKDGGVRGDSKTLIGSKQGALTGSIFSQVPVVTIEMVVLSNKADAEFIKSAAGQQKMALALAAGVRKFVSGQNKNINEE
jgi:N-acetylmuramoyl-L-alanine amidase